jgi:hypothetical protein
VGCRCFAIARPTVLSTHVAAAVAKMWRCITSVDASIHQASDMHQSTKHLSCINLSSICHASIYQASVMHQSIKHLSCINPSSICHASIYQASVMHQSTKHLSCLCQRKHPAVTLLVYLWSQKILPVTTHQRRVEASLAGS